MSNDFKVGDLVYVIDEFNGIKLVKVEVRNALYVEFDGQPVNKNTGRISQEYRLPHAVHATPKNRQALATLYGEDAVPKLPLRGSELTKKLLETQKYVVAFVNFNSDRNARLDKSVSVIKNTDNGCFRDTYSNLWNYAVPIDPKTGNEITEVTND